MIQSLKHYIMPLVSLGAINLFSLGYIHLFSKNIFYFPIMFASIFVICKYFARRSIADLAIAHSSILRDTLKGALYGAFISFLIIVTALFFSQLKLSLNTDFFAGKNAWSYFLILPPFYLVSAFYEELHYRGLFLSFFKQGVPKILFITLSAVTFVLIHLHNSDYTTIDLTQVSIMGLILLSIRLRTGSIITATGYHFSLNCSGLLLKPFLTSKGAHMGIVSISILTLALILELTLHIKTRSKI